MPGNGALASLCPSQDHFSSVNTTNGAQARIAQLGQRPDKNLLQGTDHPCPGTEHTGVNSNRAPALMGAAEAAREGKEEEEKERGGEERRRRGGE